MSSPDFLASLTLCPICQKQSHQSSSLFCRDYITGENFFLIRCESCKCYITHSNIDKKIDDKEYYGEIYYNKKSGKFLPVIEKVFRLNHVRNAKFLHRHFPANRILEIGCGRAYILRELNRLGSDVYCIETSDAAEWILSNKYVRVISIDRDKDKTWPFPDNFFELIIYWHVLEHMTDPAGSIALANRYLVPNGTLCISVPNISSIQARLGLKTWFHLDVPRHLFHFSKKGLVSMVENNGYQVVKISSGDRIQNLFGWFQSIANLFTPWATNSMYRFLQGGLPFKKVNRTAFILQVLTAWFWIPIGFLGFILEEIFHNQGTVTIYAKKKLSEEGLH